MTGVTVCEDYFGDTPTTVGSMGIIAPEPFITKTNVRGLSHLRYDARIGKDDLRSEIIPPLDLKKIQIRL